MCREWWSTFYLFDVVALTHCSPVALLDTRVRRDRQCVPACGRSKSVTELFDSLTTVREGELGFWVSKKDGLVTTTDLKTDKLPV
jgi:hypothetical protein